jgi:hypothetical protein
VALDQALGSVDQGALEPRERCLSRRGAGFGSTEEYTPPFYRLLSESMLRCSANGVRSQ